MKLKKILTAVLSTACAAVLTLSLASCGHQSSSTADTSSKKEDSSQVQLDESKSFTIALYSEYAPGTCENFESLVKSGFFDGTVFHRVMKDFMAQGGGFDRSGQYKQASNINGEFSANGYTKNTLSHTRGVVSMARTSQNMNSASSQFFICYSDKDTFLDGQYAAFGKVISGMEVVDGFLNVGINPDETGEVSVPATPIVILKAEMTDDDSEGHHQAKFYVSY